MKQPEVVSQINEINSLRGNCTQTHISEKVLSETVEVIQLDDNEELPNQVIQRNCNEIIIPQNTLSFQINGEDCSLEFEESNVASDSLKEIQNVRDNFNASNDLQVIDNENITTKVLQKKRIMLPINTVLKLKEKYQMSLISNQSLKERNSVQKSWRCHVNCKAM